MLSCGNAFVGSVDARDCKCPGCHTLSKIKGVFPEIQHAGNSRHVVFMVGDADIEGALNDLLWVCSLAIRP